MGWKRESTINTPCVETCETCSVLMPMRLAAQHIQVLYSCSITADQVEPASPADPVLSVCLHGWKLYRCRYSPPNAGSAFWLTGQLSQDIDCHETV